MRIYEETHPWLTFSINLSRAPAKLWALLGECNALSAALSETPLLPGDRDALEREAIVQAVTSVLSDRGSTLTEHEIGKLIDGNIDLPPSRGYLAQEAKNFVSALISIRDGVGVSIRSELIPSTIKNYNALVLDRLVLPEDIVPGEYRKGDGVETDAAAIPAPSADCEYLVESLCDWLNSGTFAPPADMTVVFGILKAAFARMYMSWIVPFGTGNNRTASLLEYHILAVSDIPSHVASSPAAHYARTREEYRRQFSRAGVPGGKVLPFLRYAVEVFRDCLLSRLETVRTMQSRALWNHFVHTLFRDRTSPADLRRRRLALELSSLAEPVPAPRILEMLPRLSLEYGSKTYKTLTRDVNDLISLGIVEKTPEGIRACVKKIGRKNR